jgi:hypothetical protein
MSKRIVVTIGVAFGLTALAAGGVVAWGALSVDKEPSLERVTTLSTEDALSPPSGMSLTPPPPDVASAIPISAEAALAVAWREEGAPGDPTTADATLALLTWGSTYVGTPVWVITYRGACVPAHGPYGTKGGGCLLIPFNTLVDATTGTYVLSYATSEGGYQTRPIG